MDSRDIDEIENELKKFDPFIINALIKAGVNENPYINMRSDYIVLKRAYKNHMTLIHDLYIHPDHIKEILIDYEKSVTDSKDYVPYIIKNK